MKIQCKKYINTRIYAQWNGPGETKPNPENCKNCSSTCAFDCAQLSVHNTAQNSSDNLPSYLQTITIAQMLSTRGEGEPTKKNIKKHANLNPSPNQHIMTVASNISCSVVSLTTVHISTRSSLLLSLLDWVLSHWAHSLCQILLCLCLCFCVTLSYCICVVLL